EPTRRVAEFWGGLVEEGVIAAEPMYTPQWNAALNDGTQIGWVSAAWAPGVLEGNAGSTAGAWRMSTIPQWEPGANDTGARGVAERAITSAGGVRALRRHRGGSPAGRANAADPPAAPPACSSPQSDFCERSPGSADAVPPVPFGPNVNVAYSPFSDAPGV